MAEKDKTEKTLEALNDVFADIVNGLLFHGKQIIREEALIDAQPFSQYKAEGKLREQERDVAKYWIRGENQRINVRLAFLGIENQTRYDRDMVFRVFGYDGAAYRAEISQIDRYPVITLVLYFGDRRWGRNKTLFDALHIPKELVPYVNDFRLNVFEIAFLPEESLKWFHSDFKIVVDYFIHKRTNPDYRPKNSEKFRHVDELLKMMSAITDDERFIEIANEEGGKPENMDVVLDRAIARGKAIGVAEGEAIGQLKILSSFCRRGLISLEDAAKEVNLTPEEFLQKVAELEKA